MAIDPVPTPTKPVRRWEVVYLDGQGRRRSKSFEIRYNAHRFAKQHPSIIYDRWNP